MKLTIRSCDGLVNVQPHPHPHPASPLTVNRSMDLKQSITRVQLFHLFIYLSSKALKILEHPRVESGRKHRGVQLRLRSDGYRNKDEEKPR